MKWTQYVYSLFDVTGVAVTTLDTTDPKTEDMREMLLSDVYSAIVVAVKNDIVLARMPSGAAVIMTLFQNEHIVVFDYLDINGARWSWWMNRSSVVDLGKHLRALPRKPFDDLLAEVLL